MASKTEIEKRTQFFKDLNPRIIKRMATALRELTNEDIDVHIEKVQTTTIEEVQQLVIDINQESFGSYVKISGNISGIVILFFPISGVKELLNLIQKGDFAKSHSTFNAAIKLSAFKEIANILVGAYASEMADSLDIALEISPPKLAHFKVVRFAKAFIPETYLRPTSLVSIEYISIASKKVEGRLFAIF